MIKRTIIIGYLILFAIVGVHAATVATYEAEDMAIVGASGAHRPVSDGVDGVVLLGENTFEFNATFVSNSQTIELIAKGNYAGLAWPLMTIKIDGVFHENIQVDSSSWKKFTIASKVALGTHKVEISFINDFYEGTPETDRNLYLDKVIIIEDAGRKVGLAWDANTEPDLTGYKIYYGQGSRFNSSPMIIEKWCEARRSNYSECIEKWQKICANNTTTEVLDTSCHSKLFGYDTVVDVGNVTAYTVTGLKEGKGYYFAATAYDEDGDESTFSEELYHFVSFSTPAQPGGVEKRDPAPAELRFPAIFSDTVKDSAGKEAK